MVCWICRGFQLTLLSAGSGYVNRNECYSDELDVNESVHRDIIVKITNKMQLYRLIYYSKSTLHVSGDVFAHHQEHVTIYSLG